MLKTLPKIPWKCPESICTLYFTYESLHVDATAEEEVWSKDK
jgi:hypothetical protein